MWDLLCVLLRVGRTVTYEGDRVRVLSRDQDGLAIVAQRADGTKVTAPWFAFTNLCYRTRGYAYRYHHRFAGRPRIRSAFSLRRARSINRVCDHRRLNASPSVHR